MTRVLVLANLGSPKSPEPEDVGRYLREFLMDPRVIDLPWVTRALLVYGAIAPFRKYRSSHAYKKIWSEQGSPLTVLTQSFAEKLNLAEKSKSHLGGKREVIWVMRYPEVQFHARLTSIFAELKAGDRVDFVPLYPHYALSSTESSLDAFKKAFKYLRPGVSAYYCQQFFDQKLFIECLAQQIQLFRDGFDFDYLLFSYHGLPEHHMPGGGFCFQSECCDVLRFENQKCYRAQTFRTTKLLVHRLGLAAGKYDTSFQSRLGKRPWIKPFTDQKLVELAALGVQKLAVVCPSFVTDCLETLEEIEITGREVFIAAGGIDLKLVPCLNDSDFWVSGFAQMLESLDYKVFDR